MQRFERRVLLGEGTANAVRGIVVSREEASGVGAVSDSKSRSCPRGKQGLMGLSKDSGSHLGEVGATGGFGTGCGWSDLNLLQAPSSH